MTYIEKNILGLLAFTLSSPSLWAEEPILPEITDEVAPELQSLSQRSGIYLRAYGGINWLDDIDFSEFDTGWRVGGSVGYRFREDALGAFSLELDASYGENDVENSRLIDGEFGLTTIAVNLIHDFNTGTRFRPYLGVGIGAGILNSDLSIGGQALSEDDDAVFLYQFIAGVDVGMTERLSVFTEYRYVGLDDFTLSAENSSLNGSDFGGHQLLFGARISF